MLCLLLRAELERGQLVIEKLEACNLFISQLATVEDEGQQVIPRPMWRYPVNAQQLTDAKDEAQFFFKFALHGLMWRFVGLGHATRHIPVGLISWVNKQQAPSAIAENHVCADPLAGLLGVALCQVCFPRFRITFVQRGVRGHAPSLSSVGWPWPSLVSHW